MSNGDGAGMSTVIVSLLRGVLMREEHETRWHTLLAAESRVRDYVSIMGLELIVVEDEGYAFLRQKERDAQREDEEIPRLISRRPLSYPVSMLLALLRRKLVEHDMSSGEARLIVDVDEMVEAARTFLPGGTTEARDTDRVVAHLRKIADLGFIRFLKNDAGKFEVRRIIKAFVTAQWLREMETVMAGEAERAGGAPRDTPDDASDDDEEAQG